MIKPTGTRIRDFEVPDMENIQQLISATIENSYRHVYPLQAINFFKALYSEERLLERSKTGKTIVLEKDGSIVGAGFIEANKILGVFVNPTFQRRGYGRKLMRELEQIAVSANHPEVSLSLALPSREFYEELGYEILKECSVEVKNGRRFHYWTAAKVLRQ